MGFFGDRIVSKAGGEASRPASSAPAPPPAPPSTRADAATSDKGSDADRAASFVASTPRFKLEDVILPDGAQAQVEALVGKIEHHHTLYERWGLAAIDPGGRRVAINLFGPPGSGKTMCAEGIASRLGRPIVTVSYAELESKYVGETPKNIVAAFAAARQAEAVLFFDEADSILGRRLTSVTQSADHGVNVSRSVMLLQLDRFEGVVVFATNLAKNYDGAFVRRILGHVEIPLPDLRGRQRLAERYLVPSLPRADDVTAAWLAELAEGLSGGEMLQLVIGAATRAVRRPGEAQRLSRDDLAAEEQSFRAARIAVGLDPGTTVREEVRAMTPDEAAAAREGRSLHDGQAVGDGGMEPDGGAE